MSSPRTIRFIYPDEEKEVTLKVTGRLTSESSTIREHGSHIHRDHSAYTTFVDYIKTVYVARDRISEENLKGNICDN